MLLIPVIYMILFKYKPMLGVVVAFKKFNIYQGIWDSPWIWLTPVSYTHLGCSLVCYSKGFDKGWRLPHTIEELMKYNKRNLISNKVLFIDGKEKEKEFIQREPKEKLWKTLFLEKEYDCLYREIERELFRMAEASNTDNVLLAQFTRKTWELFNDACQPAGARLGDLMTPEDEIRYQKQAISVDYALDFYRNLFINLQKAEELNQLKNVVEMCIRDRDRVHITESPEIR